MMSSLLLAFVQALLLPILTTELLNLQFPIPRTRRVGLSRSSDRIQVKKNKTKQTKSLSLTIISIHQMRCYLFLLAGLTLYYLLYHYIIRFIILFYWLRLVI